MFEWLVEYNHSWPNKININNAYFSAFVELMNSNETNDDHI